MLYAVLVSVVIAIARERNWRICKEKEECEYMTKGEYRSMVELTLACGIATKSQSSATTVG